MKIKPLLKTHWVHSQNPMLVSLSGLQKIVFHPNSKWMSFDFGCDSEADRDLPPRAGLRMRPASEEESRQIRDNHYFLSHDLFWRIFSGHDFGPCPGYLAAVREGLEFHFEDGETLPLTGIFRRADFPQFLDPKYYLQDSSCNWERALAGPTLGHLDCLKLSPMFKRKEDYQKSWIVILEILAWALQRKRQIGDLEVWVRTSETSGREIQDIEFLREKKLSVTMEPHPAMSGSALLTVWQQQSSVLQSGVFKFHAANILTEMQALLLGPESSDEESVELPGDRFFSVQDEGSGQVWKAQFQATESKSESLLRLLSLIENSIGSNHVHLLGHLEVGAAQFKPLVKVRDAEGPLEMAVSFDLGIEDLKHHRFPLSTFPLMAPFLGGLDVCLGLDRKVEAARKGPHRPQDLIFLRHQGLVLFSLFEMLNWALGRPLSSGEEIPWVEDADSPEADQSFERLLKYLQSALPPLLGKPEVAFENLISSRVQGIFLRFVEKIIQNIRSDRCLVFHQERMIEVKNVQSQVLPILRFVILHLIESSSGKFLTRAQSPISERMKELLKEWTRPQIGGPLPTEEMLWMDVGRYGPPSVSLLFELTDLEIDVELNGTSLLNQSNPFEFAFAVRDSQSAEEGNWFDLHPQIFFNGVPVANHEVSMHLGQGQVGFIEYRGQIYRVDKKQLPSLKALQRFWKKIKGLKEVRQESTRFGDKVYRLDKSQALELLMLKSQGFQVDVQGEWKKVFDYFESGLGSEKIELPMVIAKNLLGHQQEGAQWLQDLYRLKLGAILADEMGLGKTFQVLSFLVSLQSRGQLEKSLVIVPTSLVYNWLDERNKFAPDLPMVVFQTAEKEKIKEALGKSDPVVLVATYGLLIENQEFFHQQDWNVVAFDEAQALKNITSVRSSAARKIRSQFKICVTGTPMENNYLEFFSLSDLVVPGCLGPIDEFRKDYFNQDVRLEAVNELRLVTKPLVLRRTKAQVKMALPLKTTYQVKLTFAEKQRAIYRNMAMAFSRQVETLIQDQGEKKAQIAMFAALMRLRQICSDPSAVPGVSFPELPVKVEHFLSSLQDHLENQESVIVFTQFLSTLGRIGAELEKREIPHFTLQGSVSAKERLRLISEFQKSDKPAVMLMTLKTGGVGLNLTKASVVYHLEPWWNPAVENQATDRAHRMGQTKEVQVYSLLIQDSLEERIADLKVSKQKSFDRLFGQQESIEEGAESGTQFLSKEDFLYLLKPSP
jgi:superfamily II DNA or RNA helicase